MGWKIVEGGDGRLWRELCLHLKLTVKVSGEEWGGERWREGGEGWKVVRVILLLYRAKVAAATNRECSICSKTGKPFPHLYIHVIIA